MASLPVQLLANSRADRARAYGASERAILSLARHADVAGEIRSWPGYQPTPLRQLNGMAKHTGVATLWYKDESGRFGLGSFKALGGPFGVLRVLQREAPVHIGEGAPASADLRSGRYRAFTSTITVTCATDGNHGRAVAWGAQMFGCRCVIFVPPSVSEARVQAITSHGARVIRTNGTYDDANRVAHEAARRDGHFVVSDTSHAEYTDIPRDIMQGYTLIAAEVMDQLPRGERPSHLFLQGGVGGFAAALHAHFWESWGAERPLTIIVEPDNVACLYRTAEAGRPVTVPGPHETVMSCLAAGEVSLVAWRILKRGADFFMTVPDVSAEEAMRRLGHRVGGDLRIVVGESGGAGLAGLLAIADDAAARHRLALTAASKVLVVGTEDANDPESYQRIVGRLPKDVGV